MPLDKAKQIMNNSNATKDKPNTLNNESKNEVSQTKINEIKKKSEIAIKNQKKVKIRQRSEAIKIHLWERIYNATSCYTQILYLCAI